MTVTSWPASHNAFTSCRPMNKVPPMTTPFIKCIGFRVMGYRLHALIVIFQSEVRDEIFSSHPAERVLQLHELDENVVLGIDFGRVHGRFKVERQRSEEHTSELQSHSF